MTPGPADELLAAPIAHRGLHSPGIPENSLAAMAAAVDLGLGVELDVRLSADGVPIVHHDASLRRTCAVDNLVVELPAGRLTRLRLGLTQERVPTLAAALHVIGGEVPVLIDLKTGWSWTERRRLVDALAILLRVYRGPAAVVGFDPWVLGAMAERVPTLLRGQTAGVDAAWVGGRWWRRALCHPSDALWSMRISRPHFICFNVDRLPTKAATRVRAARPVVAWTARTPAAYRRARRHADGVVVEGAAMGVALAEVTAEGEGLMPTA